MSFATNRARDIMDDKIRLLAAPLLLVCQDLAEELQLVLLLISGHQHRYVNT